MDSQINARASWSVRKYRLGQEPGDDLSRETSPQQRIEMMWPLALEAWTLAGLPVPGYAIADAPVRKISLQDLDD